MRSTDTSFDGLLRQRGQLKKDMRWVLREEVRSLLSEPVLLSLDPCLTSLSTEMNAAWLSGRRVCLADAVRGLFSVEWYEFELLADDADAEAIFARAKPLRRLSDLNLRTIVHLHRQLAEREFVSLRDVVGS